MAFFVSADTATFEDFKRAIGKGRLDLVTIPEAFLFHQALRKILFWQKIDVFKEFDINWSASLQKVFEEYNELKASGKIK